MEKIEIEYDRRVIVPLQGGLGNQLFQLAFARHFGESTNAFLEIDLGDKSIINKFDLGLNKFELPKQPSINYVTLSFFSRKLRNLLTRLSTKPNGRHSQAFNSIISKFFIVSNANLRKNNSKVVVAEGIGFDERSFSNMPKGHNYIIGYFQSFKWLEQEDNIKALKNLKLKEEPETLRNFAVSANIEKPTIIHMRFGDYLNEKNFKVHKEYYNSALKYLHSISKIEYLWIFSDDENLAREIIKIPEGIVERWFVGSSIEPAEAFEIMRLGYNYIISNSTYSYWAATLRHQVESTVIAPAQWFNSYSEPSYLCPSKWIRI